MRLKFLSTTLTAAIAAASFALSSGAASASTSDITFDAASAQCVLNVSGAGTCVIPGIEQIGTSPYMGYTDGLLNAPPAAVLTAVTSNSPLISILSFGCSYGDATDTPCDILVSVQAGALSNGTLQGSFDYSYNDYEEYNASNPAKGSATSQTTYLGANSTTTSTPPPGYTGIYIVGTYRLNDNSYNNYLSVSLGSPTSQAGSLYYAYDGSVIGNSADVPTESLMSVGNLYPNNPTVADGVPAPEAAGLLGIAVVGLAALRRRSAVVKS